MSVRLAELMAALAVATDLGMGQPWEFALRASRLAVSLAERLRFDERGRRAVYYHALLRYIGCNADTRLLAALVGDELALRADVIHADSASPELLNLLVRSLRQANADASPLALLQAIAGGMLELARLTPEFFAGHCEVAGRLAERLGFEPELVASLRQVYARWDGRGVPALRGEAVAPSLLVVSLAQDAVAFHRLGGAEAAVQMARRRRGTLYAPAHVDLFLRDAHDLLGELEAEPDWEAALALEPGRPVYLSAVQFDSACQALADFADLKSPFMLGHSAGVARLAEAAASQSGLPAEERGLVRRAGYLHDLGRVGVSAGLWTKPGPLTEREWEKVRLHPYYTERILARPADLQALGALASRHQERLDGSGYHRGLTGVGLTPAARLLAAADVYQALTEPRPHRPAFSADAAADQLRLQGRAGRLDAPAVDAVLAAAGQPVAARRTYAAGLSERELEVLRLVARGQSIRAIAAQLSIAPKTVDNHLQHIYGKAGVTTRAGATLFALENQLL